ncbi:glycoside hydrolase [Chitinophaga silvatica]|uniref:Glycoside hydrolase n=1 Tax=Chitinophaga silvatica TaxID=2282649 RepID=A0A3E1YHZ6_9BACT|nr:glycoside hydrolase family 76 protein [Chitinophaga silvatica]RFS26987.1 glycoside hydrolase [Chitinophaga silvatica]
MMGRRVLRLALCCLFGTVSATAQSNKEKALLILQSVNQFLYEPASGLYIQTSDRTMNHNSHADLWSVCGMIQATNELERIDNGKAYMKPVIHAINQYYDSQAPAPGYASYIVKEGREDRYYDDNQWIGIAYMDAYSRTRNKWYLTKGIEIYRFMMTGYDNVTGGGIYWKENDKTTKNTRSNGPGILLAIQLYEATHQKSYLDTAVSLYNWVNQYLHSADGLYWDAIKPAENKRIDSALYAYNAGSMLQASVKLYHLTKKNQYLKAAQQIAESSYQHFFYRTKVKASYWFNAVLLRGFEALYKTDLNLKYINAMQEYADWVWERERDRSTNMVGVRPEKELLGQAGMIEIYARLAAMARKTVK